MTTPPAHPDLPAHVAAAWADDIVPVITQYIAIPNVSVEYDPEWKANGHMDRAVELLRAWSANRAIAGLTVEVQELPGRTPVIVMEIPAANGGSNDDTVLLYGHLDKQPEMTGWRKDLGPWTPVREGDRLYGRGGADDGYSTFASLTAIEAAQRFGYPHHRCVVLIEASEESGSVDLPAHLDALGDRLGTPSLVMCLDSGCLDFERMWVTTSLRGMVGATLRVDVLTEGIHSGDGSGVVPSSFRIARHLLDRIEDSATGRMLLDELHVDIPTDRVEQARATAAQFSIEGHYPWAGSTGPMSVGTAEQLLARTWRPTLSVTGAGGLPPTGRAGNVLRPFTELRLSVRLPPTCDAEQARQALAGALTADPPCGATVAFEHSDAGPGWNAPPFAPWLDAAMSEASMIAFGQEPQAFGEGGSIPFMGMLGERFPDAQFVITGVLGPNTNAHGPNEFLHLPTAERLTVCLAEVLRHHATR